MINAKIKRKWMYSAPQQQWSLDGRCEHLDGRCDHPSANQNVASSNGVSSGRVRLETKVRQNLQEIKNEPKRAGSAPERVFGAYMITDAPVFHCTQAQAQASDACSRLRWRAIVLVVSSVVTYFVALCAGRQARAGSRAEQDSCKGV